MVQRATQHADRGRTGQPGPDAPVAPKRSLRAVLARLWAIGWKHRWAAVPAMLSTLVLQMATLGAFLMQGLAIDVLRASADPSAPPAPWPLGLRPPADWSLTRVMVLVCGLVLLFSVLLLLARVAVRVTDEHFIQRVVVDVRNELYAKLQRLSFTYFDRNDTGQIINRMTSDVQALRSFVQGVMVRSVIAVVSLGVFLVYMLSVHVGLTLACLVSLPIQATLLTVLHRLVKPRFLKQRELEDRVVNELSESISGVRVIRSFGRELDMLARFRPRARAACEHRIEIASMHSACMSGVQAAPLLSLAVLIGLGGWLVLQGPESGGITLGAVWAFAGLLERLSAQVAVIAQVIGQAPEAIASTERIMEILEEPTPIEIHPAAIEPDAIHGRVEFQDVWFGYTPDQPVLRGVSFVAEPGQTIAIVGPTGSGKSTLLSLIARFYDPDRGRVLIDGVDARELSPVALRRGLGVVFQEPFLFSTSIRSNIAFADPTLDIAALQRAIDIASARDVIEDSPLGLDTIIGERGVSLSGGQRQRLTIARALSTQPSILTFDDATGAVDAITEANIQAAMDSLDPRPTLFIVAHRLSTLRKADRVLVLERGVLVDSGTHDELMQRPGHYRDAAMIQLASAAGALGPLDDDALASDAEGTR
jgi:ATP-binding cassette subfamily B protein